MAAATAFAIVEGIHAVVGFVHSATPDRPNQHQTTFRIQVAAEFLGAKYDPGKVASGSFRDVMVSLKKPNQPTYALFTGNNDAVCIAYITNSWADGQKYAWVGNWAETCQQNWYYSNIVLDGKSLSCAWVDRNGDVATTGFQMRIHEFADDDGNRGKDTSYYCAGNPSLKWYTDWEPHSITYWTTSQKRGIEGPDELQSAVAVGPVKPANEKRKRLIGTRPYFNETRLVRSSDPEHSAVKLCESPSSLGPDLVSLREGKYCDMSTREVLPLCGPGVTGNCFDDSVKTLRVRGGGAIIGRDAVMDKEYSEVLDWNA
ncbi:hypothetical protein QBC37DRAFT_440817 [Rhypophila decipiens]|uniref:Uncharacterized protein n=1 Tax=Rhypophila decipiens TaxID=261697 RepID=A0AAN6Y762_9PEZI|nr:hypothetical protein QBC37DRAFT_440817 [Rhypophila decipiens]